MIAWRRDGALCVVELGHAPCNEIGMEVLERLEQLVTELESEMPRAVVMHSSMSGGFCAGADLRQLYSRISGRESSDYLPDLREFLDRIHGVMTRLDVLPCTTIGAVHGVCFGGGFELALTCDILVADRTARFCFPELRLGIIPGFGGIPRLKRDVPNSVIRDLLLTGRSINAKRAQSIGLVSQVVAKGEALAVAMDTARQAALFAPGVTRTAKAFIKAVPAQELEQEKAHFIRLFQDPAVERALGAFVRSQDAMPYVMASDEVAS